jgi:hypothetical protein
MIHWDWIYTALVGVGLYVALVFTLAGLFIVVMWSIERRGKS